MRNLLASFDPNVVGQIDARLAGVVREHGVRIAFAIESGSRAWGFASPDSDYDCRFVFVRPRDDYLSLWPKRDVIETPLDAVLDVNGWDLRKALLLMAKGNAVILEWLMSPIAYREEPGFRDEMLAVARATIDRGAVMRHYLHLGERQHRLYVEGREQVSLKKLLYVVRPAAALRWLRLHPEEAVPPMHLPTLLEGCDLPGEVTEQIASLLARKAETRELGEAAVPTGMEGFVCREFTLARSSSSASTKQNHAMIDAFLRDRLEGGEA